MVRINLNKFTFLGHLLPFILDLCELLNVPRFAGSTSSLGWYSRLADPML